MKQIIEKLFPSYNCITSLGEGQLSSTWKVKNNENGQDLAIKILFTKGLEDKTISQIIETLTLVQKINHHHLVKIINSGIDNQKICLIIVSEFQQGGDLFQKIMEKSKKNEQFFEEEIWEYIFELSNGLKALHDNGIIHRELKTNNIFISQDGLLKIGDIGVRQCLNQTESSQITTLPYYYAPEQLKGKATQKSDMWSLGCVIYELMTFKSPFYAHDLDSLQRKIFLGKFAKMPEIYTKALKDLVEALLSIDQKERPDCGKVIQYCSQAQYKNQNLQNLLKPKRKLKKYSKSQMHKNKMDQQYKDILENINNIQKQQEINILPTVKNISCTLDVHNAQFRNNEIKQQLQRKLEFQYQPFQSQNIQKNQSPQQKFPQLNNHYVKFPYQPQPLKQKPVKSMSKDKRLQLQMECINDYNNNNQRSIQKKTEQDNFETNSTIEQLPQIVLPQESKNSARPIKQKVQNQKLVVMQNRMRMLREKKNSMFDLMHSEEQILNTSSCSINYQYQHSITPQQDSQIAIKKSKIPKNISSNQLFLRKYTEMQPQERHIVFMTDVAKVVKMNPSQVNMETFI